MGGDLGPPRFVGPAEGGEGASPPVLPLELRTGIGGQCVESVEGIFPAFLGHRKQGEDAEEARAAVGGRHAFDPLHRIRDPVVLRVSEPDAPGREGIELGGQGRGPVLATPPARRGPRRRVAPGDRGDGSRDRLPPGRLARDSARAGHDPGRPTIVADPALRNAPVRLVEQPGDVGGEAPVAALQGDLDPMPEVLRGPPPPLRPELERAVARLVLGSRHAPQPRGGLESGEVIVGLEEGPRPQALDPGREAARREGGVHLQETGPAALPREAVEPLEPHEVRHRRVRNGGEERLDRRFGVLAEPRPELEVPQPRVERVVPERCGEPVEALALSAPERLPGLEDRDALEGRPGDRWLGARDPGFGDGDWHEGPKKEEDGGAPAPAPAPGETPAPAPAQEAGAIPGRHGGGRPVPPPGRVPAPRFVRPSRHGTLGLGRGRTAPPRRRKGWNVSPD